MKRNGFTLIELLAVITVLSLLLIVAVPAIFNTREKALEGLNKEQIKNFKYSGELIALDLDDYMSEIYNCKTGSWIKTGDMCEMDEETPSKWKKITISITELKSRGYFDDKSSHCHGTTIKEDGTYSEGYLIINNNNGNYDIDYSGISCR